RESQAETCSVVHDVIQVDSIEARRAAPARYLPVNVVEPECKMGQADSGDEHRTPTGPDCRGRRERAHPRRYRDLVGGQSEPDGQPASVNRAGTCDLACQPVSDLAMPLFLDPGRQLGNRGMVLPHRARPSVVRAARLASWSSKIA